MQRSGEARPSGRSKNRNRSNISRPAAWLLDGRLEELGCADRLMQRSRSLYPTLWGLNIQFGLDQRILGARLGHAAI